MHGIQHLGMDHLRKLGGRLRKLMGLKLMVYLSLSILVRCLMGGILILERRMLVKCRSVSEGSSRRLSDEGQSEDQVELER